MSGGSLPTVRCWCGFAAAGSDEAAVVELFHEHRCPPKWAWVLKSNPFTGTGLVLLALVLLLVFGAVGR